MNGQVAHARRHGAPPQSLAAGARDTTGGARQAPPVLRPSAQMYWDDLAPLMIADRIYDYRLARYCNMLARLAELEPFITRTGASGSTYPVTDSNGRARAVRELPQAAEYRHLLELLLVYERELDTARVF